MTERVPRHVIRLFDMWQYMFDDPTQVRQNPQHITVGSMLVDNAVNASVQRVIFSRVFNWVAQPDPAERILLRIEGATRDADVHLYRDSPKWQERMLVGGPSDLALGRLDGDQEYFEADLTGKLSRSNGLAICFDGPARTNERNSPMSPVQEENDGYGIQKGVWLLIVDA